MAAPTATPILFDANPALASNPSPDVQPQKAPPGHEGDDIGKVERVMSADEVEFAKDHQNYEAVDKELAAYVSDARIEISPEKNTELLHKIDKRMIFFYMWKNHLFF